MGEFFSPWRRKFGVMTLVMACAFMAGWVRSLCHFDNVAIPVGKHTVFALQSNFGDIALMWMWESKDGPESIVKEDGTVAVYQLIDPTKIVDWSTYPIELENTRPNFMESSFPDARWYWKWGHFLCGVENFASESGIASSVIPYWSIVIPSTLLSAYLLLRKPQAKPKAITEPIPETVV